MAQSTVDLQKMKTVSSELDKIYGGMMKQITKLDAHIGDLDKLWKGEGAAAYRSSYQKNTQNFLLLAEAVNSCSQSLGAVAATYNKADNAAADAIKAKMGGGR